MMKTLVLLMLFTFCLQAQFYLFDDDTTTIKDAVADTSNWIELNNTQNIEGQMSLFVAGDTVSGNPAKELVVEVQTRSSKGSRKVKLYIASQWQVADSVSQSYLGEDLTQPGGRIVYGYWIDLADKLTAWNKFSAIRFLFYFRTGVGTQDTRIYSLLEIR